MPRIDDPSLIVFSPFDEPSGVPVFRNLAPRWLAKPSGISLDWHPHITDTLNANEPRALYPGSDQVLDEVSGIVYGNQAAIRQGFRAFGESDLLNDTDSIHEKCLVLGNAGFASRQVLVAENAAQSGFTVGFWVYPASNGPSTLNSQGPDMTATAGDNAILMKGDLSNCFIMGVSGLLAAGAQFNNPTDTNGSNLLAAYVYIDEATEMNISTPIESGAMVHVACTYRHLAVNSNEVVLYKNGRVAASGTTNSDLTQGIDINYYEKPVYLGGNVTNTNFSTDRVEHACGWGHVVSGLYIFERVLDEGEVLDMHTRGGIQGQNLNMKPMTEVTLSDSGIVTYAPGLGQGFIDASRYHNNLYSEYTEQKDGELAFCPGPFGRGMVFDDTSTSVGRGLATPSGTLKGIVDGRNGSFTIAAGFFAPLTNSFDDNIFFTLGTIGTAEDSPARGDAGFIVTNRTGANSARVQARFYTDGIVETDGSNSETVEQAASDLWPQTYMHVALAYDAQTEGVALYIDGELNQSGTLTYNLANIVRGLAYSGYPLVFGNGLPTAANVENLVYNTRGGNDTSVGEIFIANRPLDPFEVRYLASSGLSLTSLYYGPHDPRLCGYWLGTEEVTNEMMVPDRAASFYGTAIPGHMVRTNSDTRWDEVQATDGLGPHYTKDLHTNVRDTNLGFTSGTWTVLGGGRLSNANNSDNRVCASNSTYLRYAAVQRTTDSPSQFQDMLIGFEITASGEVPAVFGTHDEQLWNSRVLHFGDTQDAFAAVVTAVNAPAGSGVTVMFTNRDNTLDGFLGSGNIPYGDTARVVLHAKTIHPGFDDANHNNFLELITYIDGQPVDGVQVESTNARLWSDQAINAADWQLSIGGDPVNETVTSHRSNSDGLGGLFVKNVFVMYGAFSGPDVEYLATSGIDASKTPAGYTVQPEAQIVRLDDDDLEGYWRFSGPDSGSGVTDLTIKGNDLNYIARSHLENGGFASTDNSALNLRFVPMPFLNAPHATRASGITWAGNDPATNNNMAPFAVSGAQFEIPQSGFSVGFWVCFREPNASDNFAIPIAYSNVPNAIDATNEFVDASWVIFMDDNENLRMVLSGDGQLFLDRAQNTARRAQVNCGLHRIGSSIRDNRSVEIHKKGSLETPPIDGWQHVIWSYDHKNGSLNGEVSGTLSCYWNGELVDEQLVPTSGFHQPQLPEHRMITLLHPPISAWEWEAFADQESQNLIMSDLFYFSRPLSQAEARYIAFNGISDPVLVPTSGFMGGFILGTDGAGPAIAAGYMQGQDFGSGFMGGHIFGAFVGSGVAAGYIQGQDFGSGFAGGYMVGVDIASGVMGGYIRGLNTANGQMGGFMIGATSGVERFDASFTVEVVANEDFDASVQIVNQTQGDFDARVQIFEPICPPEVELLVPFEEVDGLGTPVNLYFVGSGTAAAGKTIEKAEWFFSDCTANELSTASGVNGDLFPISHVFTGSGYYTVRFTVTDSDGYSNSDVLSVNLASGVPEVNITLSGVPQQGLATLSVQFTQTTESTPPDVTIEKTLLDFDDGQATVNENELHQYTEVGSYRPIWVVRDSRGVYWTDTLEPGVDLGN